MLGRAGLARAPPLLAVLLLCLLASLLAPPEAVAQTSDPLPKPSIELYRPNISANMLVRYRVSHIPSGRWQIELQRSEVIGVAVTVFSRIGLQPLNSTSGSFTTNPEGRGFNRYRVRLFEDVRGGNRRTGPWSETAVVSRNPTVTSSIVRVQTGFFPGRIVANFNGPVTLNWRSPLRSGDFYFAPGNGYQVSRRLGSGSFQLISGPANLIPSTLAYTDRTTQPGVNYTYQIVAINSSGFGLAGEVLVVTNTGTPVANAGADQTVDQNVSVRLDARGSTDLDKILGDILSYRWDQIDGPTVSLTGNFTTPRFTTPFLPESIMGMLTFRLTVTDLAGNSSTDDVTITVLPRSAPRARAGADQTVAEGASVMLDGSGSTDADVGDILSYRWDQVDGPTVQLIGQFTAAPTFTAPSLSTKNVERLRFRLTVTDPALNTSGDAVTITVLDDAPAAHLSIIHSNRFTREGERFDVIATLDRAFPTELRFNWRTLEGATASPALREFARGEGAANFTAVDGLDYRGDSGSLVFPPFQTQAPFTVNTIDDDIVERIEFFTLELSEVATDPLPDKVTFNRFTRAVILDDEPVRVLVSIAEVEADEGDDVIFLVDFAPRLVTAGFEVRFEWSTADGTATANATTALAGMDYRPTRGEDRFPFGAIGYLITVPGREDNIVERDETFTLTFTAIDPLPATVEFAGGAMNMTQATGRILNDDSAVIHIADVSAQEGADLVFPILMSQQVAEAVQVDWSISSSNTDVQEGMDYQGSSGSIMIPAGERVAAITVPSLDDDRLEMDESLVVTLSLPDDFNGALSIGSTATGTIEDNDGARVAIADATAPEGGALSFAVSLSQAALEDLAFNVATTDGSATAGDDYRAVTNSVLTIPTGETEAMVTVMSTADTLIEGNEDFTVTLSAAGALPGRVFLGDDTAIGTIKDSDVAMVRIADARAAEGDALSFAVSLERAAVADVALNWSTADGTATAGDDYRAVTNRVLTIPAGATEAAITVMSIADTLVEEDESFTVELSSAGSGPVVTFNNANATATGIIENDDTAIIAIDDATATEGGDLVFAVQLTQAAVEDIGLTWSTSGGTATSGADYRPATDVALTISAGETEAVIIVTSREDTLIEGNEDFTVTLSVTTTLPNGVTLPDSTATGTIEENDTTTVTIDDAMATEGEDLSFAVRLTQVAAVDIGLTWSTSNGTATAGDDYRAVTNRALTIPAGDQSAAIIVTSLTDSLIEGDEDFTVTLSAPAHLLTGVMLTDPTATGTITPMNHLPTAQFIWPTRVREGETVTLDGSGSSDPDGDDGNLTYIWSYLDAEERDTGARVDLDVTFDLADPVRPTFVAPNVSVATDLIVSLVVRDERGGESEPFTLSPSVAILVLPTNDPIAAITVSTPHFVIPGTQPPQALTPSTAIFLEGETVTLDSSGSSDPLDQGLRYQWTAQTGSTPFTVTGSQSAMATFVTPALPDPGNPSTYDVMLVVKDASDRESQPASATIRVVSQPMAEAGDPQTVVEGTTVTLNGEGSIGHINPNTSAPLIYAWAQTGGTQAVDLENADTARATFTAPDGLAPGMVLELAFELTITTEFNVSASDTAAITVVDAVAVAAPDDQTYTLDTAITDLTLPEATGGIGAATYTLTGPSDMALATAVPGLTFDATGRVLSGTPTTAIAQPVTLTYTATDVDNSTATDDNDTATATFTITVADAVAVTAPVDQTYIMDAAITDLTLPEATGGTAPLTYTLAPLPDGLTFDVDSRVLSGTPTTMQEVMPTYTATDKNGASQSATFTITVRRDMLPAFAVTEFDLPEDSDPPQVMLSATDGDGETVTLALGNELDGTLFSLEDSASTGGTTTANLRFIDQPDFEAPADTATAGGDAAGNNVYLVNIRASSENLAGATVEITQTIEVTVTNIDDNAPVLAPKTSPLTSIEGEMAPLQTFSLTDADAGEAQSFALSGTDASLFELHPTSGVLTLAATTTAGNYSLTVTGTSGSREDAFTFTVTVIEDTAPAFVETSFSVAENTNDPIVLTATDANNDDVMFSLQSGLDAGRFTFADGGAGDNTATLTFNAVPDFEAPLDDGGNNIYELSVQASSMTATRAARTTTETITITITGVDDNDPVLTTTQATYEVPENSTETIVTLQATDADGDTLSFEIVDNTATSPDRARFDLGPSSGTLAFKNPQDFEAPNDANTDRMYQITVQATSTPGSGSGSPPRTSNPLALAIRLTAIDEDEPTITPAQATYNFLTGATGTIATFTIEDDDAGETRTFDMLEAAPGSGTNLADLADFSFDPSSGALSFQGPATAGTSALIIHATSGTRPAMRTITITVMSDNPAVFADTAFELPEDRNPPQVVLSATDADGATVTLTLMNVRDGALFSLEDGASVGGTTTANLRFKDQPDFENPADTATAGGDAAGNNIYLVRVRASSMDLNGVAVPITETITITVTDVDEHLPTLAVTPGPYNLAENSTAVIATLTGADQDAGDMVSLSTAGTDAALFSIDGATGELTFAAAPDFERPRGMPLSATNTNTYHLSVQAVSTPTSGSPSRTSNTLALAIRLTAIDEDEPTITPAQATYSFLTGATGTIDTFTIEDDDAGEMRAFDTLEAVPASGTNLTDFSFNTSSGALSFQGPATAGTSALIIHATSGTRTAMRTVTINVTDDNPAVFADTEFALPENSNPPRVMLSATDADGATVTLTLMNVRDGALFRLEDSASVGGTTTANLRFMDQPDFENPADTATSGGDAAGNNIYLVRVQASSMDLNGVAVPITENITIRITGVDEHLPTLAVSPGPYNLAENSTAVIATLTGADQDAGDVVRLSTSGTDAALFSIDAATGVLTFAAAPDFERPRGMPLAADNTNTYNLSVQAVSGTPPNERRSAALDLVITVTPEDESAPRIVASPGFVTYNFLTGTTGPIITFTLEDTDAGATDAGAGTGGEARQFEVLGGADATSGLFSLAPTDTASETANLTFTGAATAGTSALLIMATSGSQTATLPITVVVSNDQMPSLEMANFDVAENSTPDLPLSAPDPDGSDIDVTLSLLSGLDSALFEIVNIVPLSASATLRFIAAPDYEAPQDVATTTPSDPAGDNVYLVNIQASSLNLAGTPVNITQTIRVTVLNMDDNDPVLTTTRATYNVPENSTETIVTLQGADADGDTLNFEIAGGAGASPDRARFDLDELSGVLTFASPQNFEIPNDADTDRMYQITVQATSASTSASDSGSGSPSRTSNTLALAIRLTAIDEDEPTITPAQATYSFLTGATGTIDTFTIEDDDAGETRTFDMLEVALGSGTNLTDFSFNTSSGALSFQGPATAGTSALIIHATSGTRTAMRTITINVTSDNPAVFADTAFELPEDRNPPQVMLSATDADDATVTLTLTNAQDSTLFTLEPISSTGGTTTANLRFMAQPDFENPRDTATSGGDTAGNNIYLVRVRASSMDLNGTAVPITENITIRITGVDEHLPTLAVSPGPYNLAENSTAVIATLTGADQDDGDMVSLSTAGTDAALFSIDGAGALTFTNAPDFENPRGAPLSTTTNTNTYRLSVQAVSTSGSTSTPGSGSGSDPSERRSAALDLVITVTPVDEDPPVLAPKTSPLTSIEGEMAVLQTFTLVDTDAGEAQVFALSGAGASSFELNPTTGVLTLAATTAAGSYSLTVTGTSGSRVDAFDLTVNVAADAAPAFVDTSFSVVEGTNDPITLVATEANNDDVVFALQGGPDDGRFTFADGGAGANTATLTFNVAPDFEAPLDEGGNNIYQVNVQASSMTGARAARTTTETITITITPVDDNDPVLTTTQATYEVPENSTETIVTLQGTDADGDTLNFEIVDNTATSPDRARFDLGASTGVLAFTSPQDFEAPNDAGTDGTYEITVQTTSTSTSGGSPSRTSNTLALAIRLTAIDEDEPTITPAQATYNFLTGTTGTIATFTIVDSDTGETRAFSVPEAAPGSGTDLSSFVFDTASGALSFQGAAANATSALIIRATSGTRTAMRTITIRVTDDNPAVFADTAFGLPEDRNPPQVMLSATDPDGATVTLELTSARDSDLFSLEGSLSTGGTTMANLRFMTRPDFENPVDTATADGDAAGNNIYLVRVRASSMDLNGTVVRTTENIRITVTGVDEHLPTLAVSPGPYNLAENSTAVIATLTGADQDAGDAVRLSTAGTDAALFSIDGATGELTFTTAPDFERPRGAPLSGANTNTYNLSVQAVSSTPPNERRSITSILNITVTPVDEEAPVLAPRDSPIQIFTDATAVQTFTLVDADAGEAQAFALSGANANLFTLNTTSGVLRLAAATGAGSYDLTVTGTSGSRADTLTFTVNVAADAAPVFVDTSFSVVEGTNDPITLTATEANNDDVVFALQSGLDAGRFTLADGGAGANTATLTFNAVPDFENPLDGQNGGQTNNVYQMRVQASSMTDTRAARTTASIINITVTDVDDNDPALTTTQATYEVPENTTETIVTLQGTDADGNTLNFEIVDNAATSPDRTHFDLDSSSGALAFVSRQDFEAPNDADTDRIYQITVQATSASTSDSGSGSGTQPRASSPLALAIRLTAVDEADPTITPVQAAYSFLAGATGTIATFTIEDSDAGEARTFGALEAAPGSGTSLAAFSFDTASGALSFARPASAATSALIITATSGAKPATRMITLTVDSTDAPPAFVETTFSQAENATPTFTLAATEADGDDVSFTLQSGGDANYFTLTDGGTTANTAALVFRDAPNFENPQGATLLAGDAGMKNTYQMNVRAASTTSPNAEKTMTQIITINVTDADDPPVFTTAADALMIMEGETALTTMIEVIDQDDDPVTLALTGGTDQTRLRLTGSALSFAAAPDFEAPTDADTNNSYAIEITASSTSTTAATGATALSAVRTFHIAVTDADDNAPELTSPTTFQVQSGETAVVTLEATDADAGDTETIVFALSGGADQTQFSLTSAGVLSFTSVADFTEPTDADADNIYAIEITLTSGSRPHVTEVALEIEVINIDRQSRQRIGNVILAHIARNLADNTQDVISARTSGRLTNHLALNNQQGNFNDLVGGIQGFSFMRKLDAKQTQARGFSLWGKGHIRAFSASPNETAINSFSGHTYNLNLGADYQTGALLFGGLVTASQSNVKFTSGSAEGEGKIRTKLTTFAPYVHLRFKSGTELWGSAGFGQGRMRYQSETTGGFERTDLKYAQFAGGLYQPLKALQKTNLALKVDGYTARLKADAKENVFLAMAGDVSRVRALLEVERDWQGAYYSLTSKLNGGARLETGDIGKGIGFEFGAEIAYVNPACGFSLSADINTILLHTAQRYRHLDAGLRLLLDPGTKKRGLQFRLEPRIGGTTSAAPLWDGAPVDGSASPVQQLGTSGLGQLQTALGLSYGFAARQSLLTPFTEMRLDDHGAPIDLMLGMRFSRANLPINITLYTQKVFRSSDIGATTTGTTGTTPGVHLRLNWR